VLTTYKAELVSGARRHDHITPVLRWLPVRQRIIYKTRRCWCGSACTMQPLAIWLTCVCRPTPYMVASSCVPRRLGLYWCRASGPPPVSAASPSMDHERRIVCQLNSEHQIRLCTPSSVISRPTCFSGNLRCCWQVGSAPFVRRRCDCSTSSAPFTNIQTYLLTFWCTGTILVELPSLHRRRNRGGEADMSPHILSGCLVFLCTKMAITTNAMQICTKMHEYSNFPGGNTPGLRPTPTPSTGRQAPSRPRHRSSARRPMLNTNRRRCLVDSMTHKRDAGGSRPRFTESNSEPQLRLPVHVHITVLDIYTHRR